MDKLTKEQRRNDMQAVKNKDSKIEQVLRNALKEKGLIFAENYNKVIGKPDMVFFKEKLLFFAIENFGMAKTGKQKRMKLSLIKRSAIKKLSKILFMINMLIMS